MSHRREQFAASLQRVVGQLIAEGLNDPRIRGMISVTGVELSPDDRHARILISVLPAEHEALAIKGLESAAKHLRRQSGERLRRRVLPIFRFEVDHSLKKQAEVLAAINRATADQRAAPAPSPPDESEPSDEGNATP